MPGALLGSMVVLALAALAAWGRIARWLPVLGAGLASLALLVTYLTVAFEVDYLRTPRPGLGLLVSAVGTVVLGATAWLTGEGDLGDATAPVAATSTNQCAGSDIV